MRAFKYDSDGRLLFERIPEMSATINDGTGNYWSTKYTYTDWGAVATKQDARGVITTYGYDTLNRLTSISYNTSGAPGVASTPSVTYSYDNGGNCDTGAHEVSGGTTKGLLLSMAIGTGYSESYSYDSFKRVQAVTRTIDGHNYTTSFQFNTANQTTQMTYPSGRVINLGHDNKGRLASVGSFLTGVTYNGIGQLTGTTLGNGVSETYDYDANRMQLTRQTATKSGGPTNGLMDLNYNYQASAGQMGTGSTAGNAGQLMAINNNSSIGGVAESAAYSYDNLGRLVTSDQTSNGSTAQRRFALDRWGNRTGVWDATSGGNQIQTIELEQSGGVPTNRIQSVTGPGRANFALAANGATASASSSFSTDYPASAAINGDRKGTNWGNGGGWMDGTSGEFPDWLEVDFGENKTIDEIDVFTVQDDYVDPSEPTESMTFSKYGVTDFQVWSWGRFGWTQIASVTENDKVWKKITFSPITTDKIRVHITRAADEYSRVTEVEAWGAAATTSNYAYDPAGNVTNDGVHSYVYDAENRLVSVDGGATGQYSYDQSNQRYKKVTVGSTTHYIWQGSKVIAEHNGSTGGVLTDYVYSGARMIAKVESGTTQYFLSDRLSTRVVLDTSGNVVGRQATLPFGEDFAESGTHEKHHFTSYERDSESGLDYGINRAYSPNLGRFMRVDPYRASCQSKIPQRLNRYAYTRNDPINKKDHLGLDDDCTPQDCPSGKAWDVGECKCNPVPGPEESVDISAGPPDPRFVSQLLGPLAPGTMGGEAMEIELPPVTSPSTPSVDPQPESCDDCCASAWDFCWDKFLEELSIITPSPRKAAAKALKKCLGGMPWGSGLNAGCMGARLLDAGIAGQKAIVAAVDHWFKCMGSQMEICRKNNKDCWCDFGG